jgi:hypothetical protein
MPCYLSVKIDPATMPGLVRHTNECVNFNQHSTHTFPRISGLQCRRPGQSGRKWITCGERRGALLCCSRSSSPFSLCKLLQTLPWLSISNSCRLVSAQRGSCWEAALWSSRTHVEDGCQHA